MYSLRLTGIFPRLRREYRSTVFRTLVLEKVCLFWTLHTHGITQHAVFVPGFSHWAHFRAPPVLQHVSEFHSLLWLNGRPLRERTTFYLSIHQAMAIWASSTLDTIHTAALNIHEHAFCRPRSSALAGVRPGVESLGHGAAVCLTFAELPEGCTPRPPQGRTGAPAPHVLTNTRCPPCS